MIVRLKGCSALQQPPELVRFQFYDSPIKSLPFAVIGIHVFGFNSMIVRLKAVKAPLLIRSGWFQFYDSPIKRLQHL